MCRSNTAADTRFGGTANVRRKKAVMTDRAGLWINDPRIGPPPSKLPPSWTDIGTSHLQASAGDV
jgi:hypothetical protein